MSGIYIPPTPALIGAVPTSREVIAGSNVTIDGGASADLSADIIIAATGGGGGGGSWAIVDDFTLSGSLTEYDVDVSAYDEILAIMLNITASASVSRQLRISVDGGVSFYSTLGDYNYISSAGVLANNTGLTFHATANAAARSGLIQLFALRETISHPVITGDTTDGLFNLIAASSAPITDIRYCLGTAGTMNTGRLLTLGK